MSPYSMLITALALGAVPAMAAPSQQPPSEAKAIIANRQALFTVYACTDSEWRGRCQIFQAPMGQCCKSTIALASLIVDPCPRRHHLH